MIAAVAHEFTRNWWLLGIRGVAAVVFGVLALILPGITLVALILLFAAYALVDGAMMLISAFQTKAAATLRLWLLLVGAAGLGAGIVAIFLPGLTALVLLYVIAAWAILRGVFEIAAAIHLRRQLHNEWLLLLVGAVSIAFGMIVAIDPGSGALAVVWLIGLYAILAGVTLITLAWRMRGVHHCLTTGQGTPA